MKFRKIAFSIIFIVGMFLFFGPTDNWSWDPSFYYAHIRSPLVDGDLDFRNETVTGSLQTGFTETGLQDSIWPVGPSILWSPLFLLAHLFVLVFQPAQANGFYFPYISMVSIASICFGIGALLMIYVICRRFAQRTLSIVTVFLCFGATPLFFYIFRQPIMAHTTGLFASAALVLTYLVLVNESGLNKYSGILFGVMLGLCFLTRWSGILMITIPAVYFWDFAWKALKGHDPSLFRNTGIQLLLLTTTFLLVISPQIALWYRLHNRWFVFPQSGSAFVENILPINFINIFLDTNRGLVFWCPFIIIGMIGIGFIADKRLRLLAIVNIFLLCLLIGYRVDWFSGGGFGSRYFIEMLPFVAIGFTSMWQKIEKFSISNGLLLFCSIVLILHQQILIFSVEHAVEGWVDLTRYLKGEPLGIRWQIDNFRAFFKDPSLLLLPRPYVAEIRQTMATNLLSGIKDFRSYQVTGFALILSSLFIPFMIDRYDRIRFKAVVAFCFGIMIYFSLWSIFYLSVG